MKYLSLLLTAVLQCCFMTITAHTPDTLYVNEVHVPILLERQDNALFELRLEANHSKVVDEVHLVLDGQTRIADIAAIKLYYGGTEAHNRKAKNIFSPVAYISGFKEGNTLAANPSYSVLKDEVRPKSRAIVLRANQTLFPGVNYFWVSVKMKKNASVLSKISAKMQGVIADGQPLPISQVNATQPHYMGVGVRHAGDDGVSAYRIPGLVTTNKGTLLGIYDIRHNNSKDLQEFIEIGLSRSTNGGQTWEKMRTAMSFGQYNGLPKAQNGVGDPAILVDKATGTIWIIAAWAHGMGIGTTWYNSLQGMGINQTAQLMMVKSDDDGKTWSKPINITQQVKDPSWYFFLQGPGRGICMQDGTLVFASQYIGSDRIPCSSILYSKDHGKTWHMGAAARTNTTEAQVAEIAPGVLMLNMRDNRGGSRAVATTTDMGKTWKEHVSSRSALPESVCMASLLRVKPTENVLKKDILLFSNPNTTKGRNHITIKASLDGGVTWLPQHQLLLDANEGWGYSCLTRIDDETIGILYESSVAHMTFQAIKLRDIVK